MCERVGKGTAGRKYVLGSWDRQEQKVVKEEKVRRAGRGKVRTEGSKKGPRLGCF